jgi:hypothetical protein
MADNTLDNMPFNIKPRVESQVEYNRLVWINALTSGEYEQGTGLLRREVDAVSEAERYQYCCLGVLCDLAMKAGMHGQWSNGGMEDDFGLHDDFAPNHVLQMVGLTKEHGAILARINDNGGTFATIAETIPAMVTRIPEGD